ncbi:MAG: hypothetical protein QM802_22670 [Agriterribacter sp.]
MKKDFFFLSTIASLTVLTCLTGNLQPYDPFSNSEPQVTITAPLKNQHLRWNTTVAYTISVDDKEDGNTVFNEIQSSEVILKVVFLPDSTTALKKAQAPEPQGLSLIRTLDCFNCHGWKTTLMGPSFEMIAGRYPNNQASIQQLAGKIINGSKGVWGPNQMPAHPDVKRTEASQLVKWLLAEITNPDLVYLTGTEGVFRTKQKPTKNAGRGVYIITASYKDHGAKTSGDQKKIGSSTLLLKCEK